MAFGADQGGAFGADQGGGGGGGAHAPTPYEAMIADNIARNRAVMEALGLCRGDARAHEALRQASAPAGGGRKRERATGEADGAEGQREAVRRSQRLAGLAAGEPAGECDASSAPGAKRGRGAEGAERAGEHDAAREDHLRWAGSQRGASVVGSASYEHTLHRVMTMSEPQLARRVGAIERACGQHAVVKMRLFASVLALEGYAQLAEEATAAHRRLVEKLGPPAGGGELGEGGHSPARPRGLRCRPLGVAEPE